MTQPTDSDELPPTQDGVDQATHVVRAMTEFADGLTSRLDGPIAAMLPALQVQSNTLQAKLTRSAAQRTRQLSKRADPLIGRLQLPTVPVGPPAAPLVQSGAVAGSTAAQSPASFALWSVVINCDGPPWNPLVVQFNSPISGRQAYVAPQQAFQTRELAQQWVDYLGPDFNWGVYDGNCQPASGGGGGGGRWVIRWECLPNGQADEEPVDLDGKPPPLPLPPGWMQVDMLFPTEEAAQAWWLANGPTLIKQCAGGGGGGGGGGGNGVTCPPCDPCLPPPMPTDCGPVTINVEPCNPPPPTIIVQPCQDIDNPPPPCPTGAVIDWSQPGAFLFDADDGAYRDRYLGFMGLPRIEVADNSFGELVSERWVREDVVFNKGS